MRLSLSRCLLSPCGGVTSWLVFFFSSRRRHTRFDCDWSSDVCSSDLVYHGFRGWKDAAVTGKSGSCNIDVACPEGRPWTDEIRAVERITIGGTVLCRDRKSSCRERV